MSSKMLRLQQANKERKLRNLRPGDLFRVTAEAFEAFDLPKRSRDHFFPLGLFRQGEICCVLSEPTKVSGKKYYGMKVANNTSGIVGHIVWAVRSWPYEVLLSHMFERIEDEC